MLSGGTCSDRKSLTSLCSCYDSNVDVGSSLAEKKSSTKIRPDSCMDELSAPSGRWFCTTPVHRASTMQAARGGWFYIYLPLSARCTALSKEK